MTRTRAFPAARALAALACALGAAGIALAASAQPLAQAPAEYVDVDRVATVEGVVEAVRQSALGAQVAGRIVALHVKAGDSVKAGQVLVQIDARAATHAEAASRSQLAEARANLVNAKARYERNQKLAGEKFISAAALDQSRAEYLAAEAQVAAAAANAEQSSTTRSFGTIVAPYDGFVASTVAELGDMATPGRTLVTVFDPRALRVTATVPEAVLARASLESPVRIDIPALRRSVTARRATVVPVADIRTHTTQVRFDLPEATGLLPGQYARASLVTGRARALTVPESAILRRSEVTAVYVLDAQGRAQLRQVRVGEATGDGRVEVLAGLDAGERVALEPLRAGIEASRPDSRRS
jgi:RND family efflux transporter MFP subunit